MANSTHNEQTWNPAKLKPELPRYPWVFWTYQWHPHRSKDHRIIIRTIDGIGQPQPTTQRSPFPDGSSGIHEVILTVQ